MAFAAWYSSERTARISLFPSFSWPLSKRWCDALEEEARAKHDDSGALCPLSRCTVTAAHVANTKCARAWKSSAVSHSECP